MTPIYKNSQAIKSAVEKLSSELQIMKNVIEFTEVITGKKELLSLEQIESEILKNSEYKNIHLVAELKGIDKEYSYILSNLNNFNSENYTDTLEIKEDVLKRIEKENTTYLTEQAEQVKRKLDKVTEVLNSINRNYTKTLHSDYQGNWSINLQMLQTLTNEISR
jgi:uncharacterized membrane protein YfhO